MEVKNLLDFINESPSIYHTVFNLEKELKAKGFINIKDKDFKGLSINQNYYLKRNDSAIIAFKIPTNISNVSFNICVSHLDSPNFKIKSNSNIKNPYLALSTQMYGGAIISTWLDRPLSIAGRVFIKENDNIASKLFNVDKDLLVIPNTSIHLNPDLNKGYIYNLSRDLNALLSSDSSNNLEDLIAMNLNIKSTDIVSYDLNLYLRDKGHIIGINNEMIMSQRLDNLASTYASFDSFIKGNNEDSINIFACFDNEEVGSATSNGADSNYLDLILTEIKNTFNISSFNLDKALDNSLMLSIDNAHAVNQNKIEITDPLNCCYLNKGIAVKFNANMGYATTGLSDAIFDLYKNKSNIKIQKFWNRSDIKGGSTLASILSTKINIKSVDIGIPQLAMHSILETIGINDYKDLLKVTKTFYESKLIKIDDLNYTLKK